LINPPRHENLPLILDILGLSRARSPIRRLRSHSGPVHSPPAAHSPPSLQPAFVWPSRPCGAGPDSSPIPLLPPPTSEPAASRVRLRVHGGSRVGAIRTCKQRTPLTRQRLGVAGWTQRCLGRRAHLGPMKCAARQCLDEDPQSRHASNYIRAHANQFVYSQCVWHGDNNKLGDRIRLKS